MKKIWLLPVLLVFLTGCLGPTKTVKLTLKQNIEEITISDEAVKEYIEEVKRQEAMGRRTPYLFNQSVELSGFDLDTATEQTKEDTTNAPISVQGGQSNVDSQTENAAAEQDNSLKDSANTDNRKTDSENPVTETNNEIVQPVTAPSNTEDVGFLSMPYSHTQTNGPDKGQSLVMCEDTEVVFEKCYAGDVNIPYHGKDDGRIGYWNLTEYSNQDIVCELEGKKYLFPVGDGIKKGGC